MHVAPKFGKVELLLKEGSSIKKETFDDCGMIITGDYLIIVEDSKEDINTTTTSVGTLYHLKEIHSYKTHSK